MNIDLTEIARLVIALITAILTGFVIPWVKKKIDVENGKVTETQAALLKLAVTTAVKAAEQLYNSTEGQEKKAYVLNILKEQGYDVDSDALDAAVEAAVLELHRNIQN